MFIYFSDMSDELSICFSQTDFKWIPYFKPVFLVSHLYIAVYVNLSVDAYPFFPVVFLSFTFSFAFARVLWVLTWAFSRHLYELDVHLERFLRSASKAKISSPFSRSTLRTILIQLAAASKCRNGTLRYWLSAGPGNFLFSPAGCPKSAFYAVVIKENILQCKQGVKVITSTIPMKQPLFATMKNVNYLPNVLSIMEAEEKGAFASIWVDDDGYIAEGPNVNVAFITHDKELIMPFFDKILSGCTALRLLELAPKLVEQGLLKSVRTGNLMVEEAKGAAEMMYIGSTLPVLPIIMWDDKPIGDGN